MTSDQKIRDLNDQTVPEQNSLWSNRPRPNYLSSEQDQTIVQNIFAGVLSKSVWIAVASVWDGHMVI